MGVGVQAQILMIVWQALPTEPLPGPLKSLTSTSCTLLSTLLLEQAQRFLTIALGCLDRGKTPVKS